MQANILVIDDHPMFRLGTATLLRNLPGVGDVHEAERADQALSLWRAHPFAVITLDLSLPETDGFSLLRQARAEGLVGAVLILSMHDESAYQARARLEGAQGFIPKTAGTAVIAECVRQCLTGAATFICPCDRPHAVSSLAPALPADLPGMLARITDTEGRVLTLVGRRLTSREIAGILGTSIRTVENHRASICRKLELRGPHRLLEFALAAIDSVHTLASPADDGAATQGDPEGPLAGPRARGPR